MALKDQFETDLDMIFNADEFASVHTVNGRVMTLVMDEDLLKRIQRKSNDPDGLYQGNLLFQVRASEFGVKPVPSQVIKLDSLPVGTVEDVQEDLGLYIITLTVNQA